MPNDTLSSLLKGTTPGPWEVYEEVGKLWIVSDDLIAIGVADKQYECVFPEKPDARLIAAAPVLAKCLAEVLQALDDDSSDQFKGEPFVDGIEVACDYIRSIISSHLEGIE